MISFAKRNLKVFFKDRTTVFFSLIAVFMVILLYALFLGDTWTRDLGDINGARFLMDSWVVAGLLSVASVTTTMGAFNIMVNDRERKITKDFYSSPIKRRNIAGGYILGAFTVGVIMSIIALLLAEFYIFCNGGELLSFFDFLKTTCIIILSTMANTSVLLFIVSFFNTTSAFATATTIIGTVIGFLTGVYLPIGQFPSFVQTVIKVFPGSHGAVLLRQAMMRKPLAIAFNNAPDTVLQNFKESMGIILKWGDTVLVPLTHIIVLLLTTVVFFLLSIFNLTRRKK